MTITPGETCRGRKVLWISEDGGTVQYDTGAAVDGYRYPCVPMVAFVAWLRFAMIAGVS